MTTITITTEEATPSPAMAAMVALLMMPREYGRILRDAEQSVRQQCRSSVKRIDK